MFTEQKIKIRMKKINEPPTLASPKLGSPGTLFGRRRRSAVAARGPLGHGRHSGPVLRRPRRQHRGQSEPSMSGPRRRPGRSLSSATSWGADSTRTRGTGTPAGRGHRSRGRESSGDRWGEAHPGRRVPLAAEPPRDRQEAGAARGESKSRQEDAAREENSEPAPHSAARASLADAVSRLPFPRPTRRRHLVYRPAPRRRRTPQRRPRPLAGLTCAAVGCSFKPRPLDPSSIPNADWPIWSLWAAELTLDSSVPTQKARSKFLLVDSDARQWELE